MSGFGGYSLPATAVCPGCGAIVTLPPEPIYSDSPPAICATCETEVPDYRRESYVPPDGLPPTPAPADVPYSRPVEPIPAANPLETTRVSRAGLFRSLGGLLAERGADAVENARDRINDSLQGQ
jgi:hypothetical protein